MGARFGKAFIPGTAAIILSATIAGQAHAAAKASDVDPLRDRIGQIVYPPGVHPPKAAGKTKGIPAKDVTSHPASQFPKARDSGQNKTGD